MIILSECWAYLVTRSSKNIFKKLFWNILRKPLTFFDNTPSGEILSVASTSMMIVDGNYQRIMLNFLQGFMHILITILIAAIVTPFMIISLVISFFLIYSVFRKYLRTSTELIRRRKEALTPILTTIGEMIKGSNILRIYAAESWIFKKWVTCHNTFWKTNYHELNCDEWIRIRMDYAIFF